MERIFILAICLGVINGFSIAPQASFYPRRAPIIPSRVSNLPMTTAISSNEDLLPGIAAIDRANDDLFDKLGALPQIPYFRYYSVDILASCEYMPQELFECYTESCEIYPADEDEVPAEIRDVDREQHEFELDGWSRWDMPTDDYFDALVFSEGYTGYDGSAVWKFIHNRICFSDYSYDDDHWKADFNKAVSGLHSMISMQVIQGIREKVENGEQFSAAEIWRDPKAEFARRLGPKGETPLAIENLYFTYMLLLTAVAKVKGRLLQDCESGKIKEMLSPELRAILSFPLFNEESVSVAARRLQAHAKKDAKDSLWEARMRSRELLRIMNCVQCNKCRLHGKIAVLGLTTALQILVGRSGDGGDPNRIHRVEIAALMTTLHKFSRIVKLCQEMQ